MANYLEKLQEQGEHVWSAIRLVRDNWQNLLTGLGTDRDKTQYGRFLSLQPIQDQELRAMYHQNDIAQKIVAAKPRAMMRKGFCVTIKDNPADNETLFKEECRRLKVRERILDGMIWGRLYGGCAVIIGADDGQDASKPLKEDRVKAVRFLHVVDRRYLTPEVYYNDPMNDEHFGEPQVYRITPHLSNNVDRTVHRSRMIIFGGASTDDEERQKLNYWDHSVLTSVYHILRAFDSVWQASEHLMVDASQAVFKIKGLMAMIAGGQKEVVQTRMQLVDMSRSVARALLLDADGEDFTREGATFTDASTLLDKWCMRLASAAEMPQTILFGRSPAGMNATGESDLQGWYDTIATEQETELRPELERLIRLIFTAKKGPTNGVEPTWELKFNPLWEMTEKERAELRKVTADTDAVYISAQVVLPEEVALSRFKDTGWSSEMNIDLEWREKMLEAEKQEPTEPPGEDDLEGPISELNGDDEESESGDGAAASGREEEDPKEPY